MIEEFFQGGGASKIICSVPEAGLETKSREEIYDIIINYIKFDTGYGEYKESGIELLCRALNARDRDFVYLTAGDRFLLEKMKNKTKIPNAH